MQQWKEDYGREIRIYGLARELAPGLWTHKAATGGRDQKAALFSEQF